MVHRKSSEEYVDTDFALRVKVTDVICKIISLCTTIWVVMMVSHTKYEPSFINGCWVMTQTISAKNIKFKVTACSLRSKVKKNAYHCTWGFIGSSLLPKQIKCYKTCKCAWSSFSIFSHSSKVKGQILKMTCLCIPMGGGNVACEISSCCYSYFLRYCMNKHFALKVTGSRSKVKSANK